MGYVPGVGHAVNVTNYALGKKEVGDEGDAAVSNVTSYVPVVGHAQAVLSTVKHGELTDLAQKSAARSTGVTAGVAVGWATAPVAAVTTTGWMVGAAASGACSGAAAWGAQALTETVMVEPKNQEKAN